MSRLRPAQFEWQETESDGPTVLGFHPPLGAKVAGKKKDKKDKKGK
ncbi:MAG: hypothetical protein ABSB34_01945 [Candidatus Limnocylindrales bacterium]